MWSARRRYADNPERAEIRAAEQAALIDTRPGKIFKLFTACGFVGAALFYRLRVVVGDVTSNVENRCLITVDRMHKQVDDLRFFEREFHSRKRAYLDRLLTELDCEPVAEDQNNGYVARSRRIHDLEVLEREAFARFRMYVFEQQRRLATDPSRAGKRFLVLLSLSARSPHYPLSLRRLRDLIYFEREYRSRLNAYLAEHLKVRGPAGTLSSLLDAGYGDDSSELEREYRRRLRLQISELRLDIAELSR
jgi:hypothetical protein